MSPIIVRCSECGHILNKDPGGDFEIEFSSTGYMQRIIKRHGGKCPKCSHRLALPPKSVEVRPYRPGENAGSSRC